MKLDRTAGMTFFCPFLPELPIITESSIDLYKQTFVINTSTVLTKIEIINIKIVCNNRKQCTNLDSFFGGRGGGVKNDILDGYYTNI